MCATAATSGSIRADARGLAAARGAGYRAAMARAAAKKSTKTTAAKRTAAKPTAVKATVKPTKKTAAVKKTGAKKTGAKKTGAKTAAKKTAAAGAGALVHCYRLIFQVDAGGSRKAESFVAGTLTEAKKAALADLGSGVGAYHALFYGEEIVLQCWEGSKKLATVDLHPYITYEIEGRRPLRLKKGDDPQLDADDEDNDGLLDALCDEEVEFAVTIAWAKLKLPALRGRPLRKGQSIALEGGTVWKHGFHAHWDEKIRV
jgi:hypothetical protein